MRRLKKASTNNELSRLRKRLAWERRHEQRCGNIVGLCIIIAIIVYAFAAPFLREFWLDIRLWWWR